MSKRKLFIGTVDSLFSDTESDEENILTQNYEACGSKIEITEKKKRESVEESNLTKSDLNELNDGNDEIFHECYERVASKMIKLTPIPQNMLHLVRYSKKEIKKKHLIAKIRLRMNLVTISMQWNRGLRTL